MSELAVLDRSGDTKLEWDRSKPQEVSAAREMYDKLKAKGYLAYRTKRDGSRGDVIHEFQPEAERIVMMAQLVGG